MDNATLREREQMMLIRQLVSKLEKVCPGTSVAERAKSYVQRHHSPTDVFRDESRPTTKPHGKREVDVEALIDCCYEISCMAGFGSCLRGDGKGYLNSVTLDGPDSGVMCWDEEVVKQITRLWNLVRDSGKPDEEENTED